MSDLTFDQLLEAANHLDPAQKLRLAMRLEMSIPRAERDQALWMP